MADPGESTAATADALRAAAIDLLGVLAYAELTAFDRLAEDARLAPTIDGRSSLARMAAAEIGHHQLLCERLRSLGAEPQIAMAPFIEAIDAFHESTAPGDWIEGLVKAHVGDGFAADFYREIAQFVDPDTRDLVLGVLEDTGHSKFAVREVRAAIAADPAAADRLSLWARRLVGEALSQAQHVVSQRETLADLMLAGSGDLVAIGALLRRLTVAHSARMRDLGLSP